VKKVEYKNRIRNPHLLDLVINADEAINYIKNGMSVGFSGFTSSGDPKVIPVALAERAKKEEKPFKINVYTGASVGPDIDTVLSEAGIIGLRLPFQSDKHARCEINKGNIAYLDTHLSDTADMIRDNVLSIDIAVVEAVAITEEGYILPTTSGGNSSIYIENAKEVLVELNLAQVTKLEGFHDIYNPGHHEGRQPIPLTAVDQRIGNPYIKVDPEKIKGIVITEKPDTPKSLVEPDEDTKMIANHLINFLREQIKAGKVPEPLPPLQSGVGSVANAVFYGFLDSEFKDLKLYSEVLQDAVIDCIDAGKISFASGGAFTLSKAKMEHVFGNLENYRDKIVLRPQEISNNPEVARRLGLITMNTALEFDIYGNVNSTHVLGTKMMNGIGGSGDFTRSARIAIFVTKSVAKDGKISSVVPFVSHVDHIEHDVDVLITEQGVADLRGLTPQQRALVIIENCAHPMYRPQLLDYYYEALSRGGHTPHVMEKALSWHVNFAKNGTMLAEETSNVEI
jgi:succinyl-CoA:acetate CoA-transferase